MLEETCYLWFRRIEIHLSKHITLRTLKICEDSFLSLAISRGKLEHPPEDVSDRGKVGDASWQRRRRESGQCERGITGGLGGEGGSRRGRLRRTLKHREENIRDSRRTAWWLNFAKTVKWPAMNHARRYWSRSFSVFEGRTFFERGLVASVWICVENAVTKKLFLVHLFFSQ